MKKTRKTGARLVLLGATFLIGTSLFAAPRQQDAQQPAADNTKMNQDDANKGAVTADQQKMNATDLATTKNIRSSIVKDKSLTMYAHNIKIITQDGKVTLKGPVRSDDEKTNVEAKAAAVAGADNVTSEITVAPPKS